ncbi:adenylyl-sulfate kinase [Pararhizobium haloflavum]|uniref:adenylyl-sulfate kinase n=1 Tax=Pararhizobium haloflavum TaxID=2037914 RepID=UPI000C177D73|nr:adenylyl-sulfate kinase [Pararhizobium haloflavum]
MAASPKPSEQSHVRMMMCGSVDDGKSTLLGRMLLDCGAVFDDQLHRLSDESRRYGTTGKDRIDPALLLDGLADERQQGITIDVAYRYFATRRRAFIVADTPGHEQYTRNMATAASTAELAVLLVDVRKGLVAQTRRHMHIVQLLGVRRLVLAINKMDLAAFSEAAYRAVDQQFAAFAEERGIDDFVSVPVSALSGDNVVVRSSSMPWFDGPTLLDALEAPERSRLDAAGPARFPVQMVCRPDSSFRGFQGTVRGGSLSVGQRLIALPSGRQASIARVTTMDGDLEVAAAGRAVTLVLDDEIDIVRGDVLAPVEARPEVADQFTAHMVWMDEQPMLPGRRYLLRIGARTVNVQVTDIKYRIDVESQRKLAARTLSSNDIAVCNLSLDQAVPFDPYRVNRDTGGFIFIDPETNATLGCGMIDHSLRRSSNVHRQAMRIDRAARSAQNRHRPCILWFTGLSGAGKSTVADAVEQRLFSMGCRTMSLDGDNVRQGLNRDLGFTVEDRVENIRRVAEVARLMLDAGLITLVSFISPFRSERELARSLAGDGTFLEIFVDAPLRVCEERDPKGLYRKARSGSIPNFTGIGSPYEAPTDPELRLQTDRSDVESLAERVIALLAQRGVIDP